MIMAHDPTRHWPLGVGPQNTRIPGAAWLELLDGQAFPVVGAGAMVWNGPMWVPVSTQNRLPVDAAVSGTVDVSNRADRQLGQVALSGRTTAVGGRKTVALAGNPEPLGNQAVGNGVYVVADPNNTGAVYVFPAAGAKTDVVPLYPGDSDFWPVTNINALKVDADVSGDGVYWKGAV